MPQLLCICPTLGAKRQEHWFQTSPAVCALMISTHRGGFQQAGHISVFAHRLKAHRWQISSVKRPVVPCNVAGVTEVSTCRQRNNGKLADSYSATHNWRGRSFMAHFRGPRLKDPLHYEIRIAKTGRFSPILARYGGLSRFEIQG
jgi:hypothetical protein